MNETILARCEICHKPSEQTIHDVCPGCVLALKNVAATAGHTIAVLEARLNECIEALEKADA